MSLETIISSKIRTALGPQFLAALSRDVQPQLILEATSTPLSLPLLGPRVCPCEVVQKLSACAGATALALAPANHKT